MAIVISWLGMTTIGRWVRDKVVIPVWLKRLPRPSLDQLEMVGREKIDR